MIFRQLCWVDWGYGAVTYLHPQTFYGVHLQVITSVSYPAPARQINTSQRNNGKLKHTCPRPLNYRRKLIQQDRFTQAWEMKRTNKVPTDKLVIENIKLPE